MNQLIVFPFFGERYLKQFLVCAKTIPKHWQVIVITDQQFEDDRFSIIWVDTPASDFDKMIFRRRIPEFVNIEAYDQVWHCDPDVLFTGDLLEKYGQLPYSKYILVSDEPGTKITDREMGVGFDPQVLELLSLNHAPAINGGLIGVPKDQNGFWAKYSDYIDLFHSQFPDVMSCDQQVLNVIYHSRLFPFALIESEDIGFPTRGPLGKLINHFIGFDLNKHEVMQRYYESLL
jgi:hypothetical protein